MQEPNETTLTQVMLAKRELDSLMRAKAKEYRDRRRTLDVAANALINSAVSTGAELIDSKPSFPAHVLQVIKNPTDGL